MFILLFALLFSPHAADAKSQVISAKAKQSAKFDRIAAIDVALKFVEKKSREDGLGNWKSLEKRLVLLQSDTNGDATIRKISSDDFIARKKKLSPVAMMFERDGVPAKAWLIEFPNHLAGGFEIVVDGDKRDVVYIFQIIEG